jgi:integrase
MATIRKRHGKYEVQIRRIGQPHISRTFIKRKDAQQWARQMELAADRHDLPTSVDRRKMAVTLGALVQRYRDTVTVRKRAAENERITLKAFALHPICRKSLSELRTSDFAAYRDERLKTVKPISLKRELSPLHHLFEIARDEWGIPIKENPIHEAKVQGSGSKARASIERRGVGQTSRRSSQATADGNDRCHQTRDRDRHAPRMTWDDIDWSEPSLRIPLTKNGEARTIPLSPAAVSVLQARKPHKVSEADRVFQRARDDSNVRPLPSEGKCWRVSSRYRRLLMMDMSL